MLLNRSKLQTNLTTGISVMSYPTPDRFSTDIMWNGRNQWSQKTLTPGKNKIERSVLRRSKENTFLPDGHLKTKNEIWKCWELSLVEMFFKNSPDWSTAGPIKFNMLLCPALFSLEWWKPQVSSSFRSWVIAKNTHPPSFLEWAVVVKQKDEFLFSLIWQGRKSGFFWIWIPKKPPKKSENPKRFQQIPKNPNKNPRKSGNAKSKIVFSNILRSYFQVLRT